MTAASIAPELRLIPLAQLRESPLNTRKHFDPGKLAELTDSVQKSGILTPLLVRPNPKLAPKSKEPVFEIAAGHRRFRAGTAAGTAEAPCIVRDLDDATFLEVLTIENLQREDVHALEEAEGFKNLLTLEGYNAQKIASRIGKTEAFVHDRLKLLQLCPEAKRLFLANRFGIGHAILLARIPKKAQERCIAADDAGDTWRTNGLWRGEGPAHDAVGLEPEPELVPLTGKDIDRYAGLKPVSVRELQAWIDDHVRFTEPDAATPHLFPETAANLAAAETAKAKVIQISRDRQLKEDAKDPDGKRTYCRTSWKRADGQQDFSYPDDTGTPSTTCEYSKLGLIVAGYGRGESFQVCVDKKRCTTHWGAEIKARNRRERERETGGTATAAPGRSTMSNYELEEAARQKRTARAKARWEKGGVTVLRAIAGKLKTLPVDSTGAAGKYLWRHVLQDGLYGLDATAKTATIVGIARGKTAADWMRHVIMCDLIERGEPGTYDPKNEAELQEALDTLKLRVNVTQLLDAANPEPAAAPRSVEGAA